VALVMMCRSVSRPASGRFAVNQWTQLTLTPQGQSGGRDRAMSIELHYDGTITCEFGEVAEVFGSSRTPGVVHDVAPLILVMEAAAGMTLPMVGPSRCRCEV